MAGALHPRSVWRSRRWGSQARTTAAVWVLVLATVVVGTCLAVQQPVLIAASGVFALLMGWVALRLAWNAMVLARYAHQIDRTELAHTYRGLFAERTVEHAEFARAMRERLVQRDRRIGLLQAEVTRVELRAVEAEATAGLATAVLAAEQRLRAARPWPVEPVGPVASVEPVTSIEPVAKPPLLGARRQPARTPDGAPEWVALEPDLVSSLMAWERHAAEMSRRRAQKVTQQVTQQDRDRFGRHAAG